MLRDGVALTSSVPQLQLLIITTASSSSQWLDQGPGWGKSVYSGALALTPSASHQLCGFEKCGLETFVSPSESGVNNRFQAGLS